MNLTNFVVCIEGDGIGPEVTAAMKKVVAATGVHINWIDMQAGLSALASHGVPLPQETLDAIKRYRLAIKGPTGTPSDGGHSSINVKLRKIFDLHVGYRPYKSLPIPGLHHQNIDLLLLRQNTEGLYDCTEVVSPGKVTLSANFTADAMERLAEYAFCHATFGVPRRITIITKANIHKAWGKLYKDAFMKVASKHPSIEADDLLIDATAMMLSMNPSRFDIIVTENMFGDILSDLCAGLIGGLGVAPGGNIGDDCAIFEAVHGTADDIAGQDKANPTALILSSALLLEHMSMNAQATHVRKAVRSVLARGQHVTGDLLQWYPKGTEPCTTSAFTDAVCEHILSNEP